MGTPLRRWWQAVGLASGLLLATLAPAQSLSVSRLDADPAPAQVLAGAFDRDFVAVPQAVIHERDRAPRWWRLVATRDIARADAPQLVLQAPYLNRVEVWAPGQDLPVRRALTGVDADPDFSTRALVVALPDGLAAGDAIYLRVLPLTATPMPVSIESLAQVHRADLVHAAWRASVLSSLLVLAVLALGFWIGIGERSYAYLMVALLSQVGFFASGGGEVRLLPWLGEVAGTDPRIARMFGLLGVISGIVFLAKFLDLRVRQPQLMRILDGCSLLMGLLLLASMASAARWIALVANIGLLLAVTTAFTAGLVGSLRRQRAAWFLLLSWLPMMALMCLRVGELFGLWVNPAWVGQAFPVAFVVSGLVITIGLTDTMQQLRRDRDRASRLATFDTLTGAMTRPAVEQGLKTAVAEAHRTGQPLSVVFFDIDRFKRINDEYGHRVGDSCLRIIGLRTRNRLRTYDLFGRFGGDEILVVLPDTRLNEALGVAENLRSAVNCRPLSIDGQTLEASLSLGVAELAAGESAEHLLERADEALYASKSAGRDRVTGHDSRETTTRGRLAAAPK